MRFAITSQAVLSPAGDDIMTHHDALLKGGRCLFGSEKSGASLCPKAKSALAAIKKEKAYRSSDPMHLMALLCARRAREQIASRDISSYGIVMGSARGPMASLESYHKDFLAGKTLAPSASPQTTGGAISALVARDLGCEGMALSLSTTCATSLTGIGTGVMMLASGFVPGVLIGAAESANTDFFLSMLKSSQVLSKSQDDAYPAKPFHKNRSGMVLAEGAFCLSLEHDRGQKAHGFVRGFGSSMEKASLTGITAKGLGLQKAIKKALETANMEPCDMDFIVAHGSGTPKGDAAEMKAYRQVFDKNLPPIALHKWLTGHSLAASGGISTLLALSHLKNGVTPTAPYETELKATKSPHRPPQNCLVTSLGFGGYASCVVLSLT